LDDKRDAQSLDRHYRRTKRDRATDSLDDAMPVVENKESSAKRPDEQALLGELSGQVQSALTKTLARITGSRRPARLAAAGIWRDSKGSRGA